MKRTPVWAGALLHIYNRGVDKRAVFKDAYDQVRFLASLHLANSPNTPPASAHRGKTPEELLSTACPDPLVDVLLAVPMPNHFHSLIRVKTPIGVPKIMQRASNSYTKYFNRRHGRSGHLFERAYGRVIERDDRQLKYVIAYIILNPVALLSPGWEMGQPVPDREAAIRFLETYPNSNLPEVLCGRKTCGNLCTLPEEGVVRYYGSREALREQVFAYLR